VPGPLPRTCTQPPHPRRGTSPARPGPRPASHRSTRRGLPHRDLAARRHWRRGHLPHRAHGCTSHSVVALVRWSPFRCRSGTFMVRARVGSRSRSGS
jgi:hypothetical protein